MRIRSDIWQMKFMASAYAAWKILTLNVKEQVHDFIAGEMMAEIPIGLLPTWINPARRPAAYFLKTKH
jgi:hypothetical protein